MLFAHSVKPAVLLLTLAAGLGAQDQTISLKNWAAPLYWQPPVAEDSQAKAGASQPHEAATYTAPLVFVGMTPCRVMDTRAGQGQAGAFGPPSMTGSSTRTVPIPTHPTCGIPSNAQAYSFNVTVVPQGSLGFLSMWPNGQPQPLVSTLNALDGLVTANAAVVPAGTSGSVNIYVTNTADVIVDINGYYMPPSALALGAGSAAVPSLSFGGDAGTGVFSSGPGTLDFSTGGTARLSLRPDGDLDLTGNIRKGGSVFLHNRGGTGNTGLGVQALGINAGDGNTASGYWALSSNTTGDENTASGFLALSSNTTGNFNTASGSWALFSNTTGHENTASGEGALTANTTGYQNTASGLAALDGNTTGYSNTASGAWALWANTTGNNNIAIGNRAAITVSATNSNNIHIGSQGASADSGTIRFGTPGTQTSFFAAGVRGVTTGTNDAIPVVIDSNGQLGTVSSSRRVKRDIHDMGDTTSTIMGLRPVRFRYKAHADGPEQYGLIAEDVAGVSSELVARNKEGEIETVYYDKVNAMLLNQVQTQHRLIASQTDLIRGLESRLTELESRLK